MTKIFFAKQHGHYAHTYGWYGINHFNSRVRACPNCRATFRRNGSINEVGKCPHCNSKLAILYINTRLPSKFKISKMSKPKWLAFLDRFSIKDKK